MNLPDLETLWNYQDPVGSERRFRENLPDARESGDTGYHVELLTQLARSVCLQRRYSDAHAILDEATGFLQDNLKRPKMRCLLERARILNDTGHLDESIQHCKEALSIGEEIGEVSLTADALHMIAYLVPDDEAIHWHNIAINYCKRHDGNERIRRWLKTLYFNIGDKYEALGLYSEGIETVKKGIDLSEESGLLANGQSVHCLLARLNRLDGRPEEAMALIQELRTSEYSKGWLFEEYAECLLATGRAAEAQEQFKLAYEAFESDPWYPPTEKERLERIKKLAGLG